MTTQPMTSRQANLEVAETRAVIAELSLLADLAMRGELALVEGICQRREQYIAELASEGFAPTPDGEFRHRPRWTSTEVDPARWLRGACSSGDPLLPAVEAVLNELALLRAAHPMPATTATGETR